MIDEISQKAEELIFYLDELTEEESREIVEHYFRKYMKELKVCMKNIYLS